MYIKTITYTTLGVQVNVDAYFLTSLNCHFAQLAALSEREREKRKNARKRLPILFKTRYMYIFQV